MGFWRSGSMMASLAAGLVLGAPAGAATVQVVYKGTVEQKFGVADPFNRFANDIQKLYGQVATATFVFNTATSVFATETFPSQVDTSDTLQSLTPAPTPFSLARMEINGVARDLDLVPPYVAVSVARNQQSIVDDGFGGTFTVRRFRFYASYRLESPTVFTSEILSVNLRYDGPDLLPLRLNQPFTVDLTQPGWTDFNEQTGYSFRTYDPSTQAPPPGTNIDLANLSLTVTCLADCDEPAVIPLPASGMLLVSGLGALALLRRRTRAA